MAGVLVSQGGEGCGIAGPGNGLFTNVLGFGLDRLTPGGGMVRFPEWLPDAFFTEMCVEMRSEKGWEAPRGHRQEAWDLAYYAIGYCVHLGVEKIEWAQPPAWALPWDAGNALVRKQEQAPRFKPSKALTSGQDFAKLLAS